MLSENGGVVDGPATDPLEHQLLSSAYQLLLQVLLAVDGLIQTNLSVLSGEGGRWWASCALCLAVLSLYWNPGSKEFEHLDPAEDKAVLVNAMAVQLVAHLVLRLDVPELLGGVRRLEVGVA